MNLARDKAFARPRLALQENRRVEIARGEIDQLLNRVRQLNWFGNVRLMRASGLCTQHRDFLTKSAAFRGAGDRRRQGIEIDRLFEHIGGAVVHRPDRRTHIRVPGEHDDRDVRVVRAQRLECHQTAGIGETEVEQYHVGGVLASELPTLGGRGRAAGRVAERREKIDERLTDRLVVIDDED